MRRRIQVRHVERSSTMLEALTNFFHAPADIQVYLTLDQSQAFGWHDDLDEVYIIQAHGCKEHTIRQNTLNPWPGWDNMPVDLPPCVLTPYPTKPLEGE